MRQCNDNNNNNLKVFFSSDNRKQDDLLNLDEIKSIQREMVHYEDKRSASIEALKIVQKSRGWISDLIMKNISDILGISVSDLEGVATFYNQIFRKPVNRHIIRYCDSVVCYMFQSEYVRDCFKNILNINVGESTSDGRFTLLPTCCLGKCDEAPVIMVNDDVYTYVVSKHINEILDKYI